MNKAQYIKKELIVIIRDCTADNMELLLYELQSVSLFKSLAIKYLAEFDNKYFSLQSDSEMAKIIKSGIYQNKFIEWLMEDYD